ncbi:patatin-like phospholipase family protein [Ruegeria pomeroyi]|nr:patatin-like phospholipase family protein [Ruegeria pomeroyi]MCE8534611.1 patatin-like phospholipase family protein [Ruegeria pomeroyi]
MRWLIFSSVFLIVAACSGVTREPVSILDLKDPQVPGIEGSRYWADETPPNLVDLLKEIEAQRRASGLTGPSIDLTLSGGGENGAFAAGILTAWSESGTRPEFGTVTGVSTGALTAPFAFLGPEYDDELRRLYGGLPPSAIFSIRSIFGILPNASVYDTSALERLLEEYVDADFLEEIAVEHKRGRRLLVQSVSLDAQRPVIWDLGRIAASNAPNAVDMFRSALLASASVPGVFPPVLIDVETDEGIKDELHVDGGVNSQSAFLPGWNIPTRFVRGNTVYAIRNGKVLPEPEIVKAGIAPVSARSLATMIKVQGANDLREAYARNRQTNGRYFATWISLDFSVPLERPFDPEYMQALFKYGYDRFKAGNLWSTTPP